MAILRPQRRALAVVATAATVLCLGFLLSPECLWQGSRGSGPAFLTPSPQLPTGSLRGSGSAEALGSNETVIATATSFGSAPLVGAAAAVALLLSSAARRRRQFRGNLATRRRAAEGDKISLDQVKVGDQFSGTVTRDAAIGIYIDIGAEKDALWPRNQVPKGPKFNAGDKIEGLTVTEVSVGEEASQRKIRVSTKMLTQTFAVGQKVKGTVQNSTIYGVFFDIGATRPALAPVRLLAKAASEYVKGEEVEMTIASIEGDKLSLTETMMERSAAAAKPAIDTSKLKVGQKVEGKVVRANERFGVFLDIGVGADALCRTSQLEKAVDLYKEGDTVTGLRISNINVEKSQIEVTTRPLVSEVQVGQKLEGTVTTVEKFGVYFDAGYASDVLAPMAMLSKPISDYTRGEVADLIVMRVQADKVNVSTKSEAEIGTPLGKIVRGASVSGKVVRVDTNIGIFLDIGAAKDALWRVRGPGAMAPPKPIDEYEKGEEVTGLIVLKVDAVRQELEVGIPGAVSMGSADAAPSFSLQLGDIVEGTVTRVMDFGVFVDIGAGRDALFATNQLSKPLNEYKQGDKLTGLKVVEVDPTKNRLAVSEKKTAVDFKVGDPVPGKVTKIMAFGLFVDIGASTDALAPTAVLEKELGAYVVGEVLTGLKIEKLDAASNKISVGQVASRGGADKLSLDDLQIGAKLKGMIRSAKEYGLFVDIGVDRRDALLPLEMLPPGKPVGSFDVNTEIEVYIAQIDKLNNRVTVSAVELTEEMKKSPAARRMGGGAKGTPDAFKGAIPLTDMIPDPKYHAARLGREDMIDDEPTDWYAWEKKFPGFVKFPQKETELYICDQGYGFSGVDSAMKSGVAYIPIPVHLRKADAGPPEIPPFDFEDFQIGYDYGIKHEIHIKYRDPPLNDPNWTYRKPMLNPPKPLKLDVVRQAAGPFVPLRKKVVAAAAPVEEAAE